MNINRNKMFNKNKYIQITIIKFKINLKIKILSIKKFKIILKIKMSKILINIIKTKMSFKIFK